MGNSCEQTYTIADLSRELSVTARTLRFYEDQGMLNPNRIGQTRIYSNADKARIRWILRGKSVGFSLAEIKDMLDLYDIGDGRLKQRAVTLEKCRDRLLTLKEQRDNIEELIADLTGFVDLLEDVIQDPQNVKKIVEHNLSHNITNAIE